MYNKPITGAYTGMYTVQSVREICLLRNAVALHVFSLLFCCAPTFPYFLLKTYLFT